MGVTFNRNLSGPGALQCGEFVVGDDGRPLLKCAICGDVFSLPSHCQIEPDGRVSPAVRCRGPSCPFFDFITLADVRQ